MAAVSEGIGHWLSCLAHCLQTKFVEIGRVAFIAHGDDKGKLCTIIDVIDQNRALVDGPCSSVGRQQINFKALHLTQFKMNLSPSCRAKYIKKKWIADKIDEKWSNSTWAKKIAAKEKRAALSDFDRFKLMKAKQARNKIVNLELAKLKKAWKKEPKKVQKKKPAAKKGGKK